MKKTYFAYVLLLLVAAACGGPTESVERQTDTLLLTAEGPLYDGSNTATYTWPVDLNTLLGEGYTAADIAKARITGIRITAVNPDNLSLINDITFQLAGSGVAMQKVGFLNPLPANANSVDLVLADEQKGLEAFFGLKEITLVADLNLIQEFEDNLELHAQLTFNFDLKSK
ncbi:MAG: hypothetical protein Q8J69_02095 [Sphingobacteriaceae bacterium]|nr:hypothetical protein [Sphingobacteriaceae bacterium]